jgi:hypothetical protein
MAQIKTKKYQEESQIRNSERIRDLAEVFTAEKEVSAMLDLLDAVAGKIDSRFLEPSCGNGNFLVSILDRKLENVSSRFKNQIEYEFLTILATASIYGVDIDLQNVKEARFRMKEKIIDHYSNFLNTRTRSEHFDKIIDLVLKSNIIKGDMINGVNKIKFIEYTSPKPNKIQRRIFRLVDLLAASQSSLWADLPTPIEEFATINYWELTDVSE